MNSLAISQIENNFPEIAVNAYTASLPNGKIASIFHLHNEIEIMYVISGSIRWSICSTEIEVKAGECFFVNSRVPHSTFASQDSRYFLVQMPYNKIISSYMLSKTNLYYFILEEQQKYCYISRDCPFNKDITEIMVKMLDEYVSDKVYKEIFLNSYSSLIILTLMRQSVLSSQGISQNQNALLKKVMPITDYINSNYQCDITLDELSACLNFSREYLCRIFKNATSKTITEYINFVRIEKSLELLSSTQKDITEIALDVGFKTLSHFNSTFRKQIGCAPSFYRKSMPYTR